MRISENLEKGWTGSGSQRENISPLGANATNSKVMSSPSQNATYCQNFWRNINTSVRRLRPGHIYEKEDLKCRLLNKTLLRSVLACLSIQEKFSTGNQTATVVSSTSLLYSISCNIKILLFFFL